LERLADVEGEGAEEGREQAEEGAQDTSIPDSTLPRTTMPSQALRSALHKTTSSSFSAYFSEVWKPRTMRSTVHVLRLHLKGPSDIKQPVGG